MKISSIIEDKMRLLLDVQLWMCNSSQTSPGLSWDAVSLRLVASVLVLQADQVRIRHSAKTCAEADHMLIGGVHDLQHLQQSENTKLMTSKLPEHELCTILVQV